MSATDLTIVALAWNEVNDLARCFASVAPLIEATHATTIVLFDPGGDEQTLAVARRVADRTQVHPFVNFSAQRNRALDIAQTRWVFFIDPDERMTVALAAEIVAALLIDDYAAYRVPRKNIFFGREVRHTGWYPDYQVRLLDRTRCRYNERREVHEVPDVQGEFGTLRSSLVHFNYRTWRQFLRKQSSYAGLQARALYRSGHRARPRSLVGQPLRELKRRLIDNQGYRDGLLGIALSVAMAYYALVVYVKLLRVQKRGC